jgi:hypothetical protein
MIRDEWGSTQNAIFCRLVVHVGWRWCCFGVLSLSAVYASLLVLFRHLCHCILVFDSIAVKCLQPTLSVLVHPNL